MSINFRDFQVVAFNLNYNILIIYYTTWNQQVKQHAEMWNTVINVILLQPHLTQVWLIAPLDEPFLLNFKQLPLKCIKGNFIVLFPNVLFLISKLCLWKKEVTWK